jgi:CheY-like chemotaxis protein
LHLAVPDDLPPVAVDPEPLRQLLGHLLANAREAIAEAGVVTLSARRTDLEELDCLDLLGNPMAGPHVELVVTDTGCGISPEARARLFLEPFFTTKPRHRGLGLAAVFGLLQSHRGGLRLGPTLEQGTAVRVFLPLAFEASRSTLGDASPSLASGEKVLVVDDDPLLLQFVCTTLQRAGYRVQGAAGADEALHSYTAAAKEPFRLVLSDVLMPRMNGFELARHLLGRDPTVNLLFISGHVPPSFPHDDLLARNFELLPKPFRPDELLRAVRTALDRGSRSLRV